MPIRLTDELLAKLQAEAGQDGKVTFTGVGSLDAEKKELEIESIDDVPVEYSDEAPPEEEKMEGEAPAPAPPAGSEKPGMAIMMAFKKAAGHK